MATGSPRKTIAQPQLLDTLSSLKNEILKSFNCVKVGQIHKFDSVKRTAEVQILFKRTTPDGKIVSYPLLVDCPVFTLQGGGALVDMPITAGDQCLILFSDRSIDAWFKNGSEADPFDARTHDLSDGFALVGVNALTSNVGNFLLRLGFKDEKVVVQNSSGTLLAAINGLIDVVSSVTTTTGTPLSAASISALASYKIIFAALLHE